MIGKIFISQKFFTFFILLVSCILLSACQGGMQYKKLSKEDSKNTKYKGHYKVGSKYTIKNTTYKPKEVKSYTQVGMASWYGKKNGFHGKKTANGDVYNKNTLSAAHKTLPLPSFVKVTNLENNKSVVVMLNDRGPYSEGRIIDLSEKAAEIIDMKRKGTVKVKVQYLPTETKKFLTTIGLEKKSGSKTKSSVPNRKCSVNCHVKLVNLQHKIKVDKG
jgi:rare lipoprotein A